MIFWLDAQLPPGLAAWLEQTFRVEVHALRDLDLLSAPDREIFALARAADATLVSKDIDFVDLVQTLGAPPRLLWVTCGNTSNARLREVFMATFPDALTLLSEGRNLIEIGDS